MKKNKAKNIKIPMQNTKSVGEKLKTKDRSTLTHKKKKECPHYFIPMLQHTETPVPKRVA